MSTLAVAKKDFHDAVRSRELWALIGLFALFLGGVTVFDVTVTSDTPSIADGFPIVLFLSSMSVVIVLVPAAALVGSSKSIVRERSHGTVTFLLALSHSRFDVYVGTLLGRLAVLTTAVIVGYLPVLALLFVGVDGFDPLLYAGVLVVALLLGFVSVVIGHGVSAMTRSETLANVAGFGVFFLMYTWGALFEVINVRFELVEGRAAAFLSRFSLQLVTEDVITAVRSLGDGSVDGASIAAADRASRAAGTSVDVPFYLQHWFAVVVLGVWIALPLALGYWRFSRAEL